MSGEFDGKVVVVTGASSGFGVAFAEGFAEAGADLVLGARRADRLEVTASRVVALGGDAIARRTDVTDPADCERLVEAAFERFGRVDVLVNNAGVGTAVPAIHEDPDDFRRVIEVNLNGAYFMAQACGRVMQPGSSIVNIGSVLGSSSQGLPQAAYASSKAGVAALTRDLAQQWTGRRGIRVNAIAAGIFATEMSQAYDSEYLEAMIRRVPVGRMGKRSEAVDAVRFLASDRASYVTGAILPVDGGLLTW